MWTYENGFEETTKANLSEEETRVVTENAKELISNKNTPENHIHYCLGVLAAIELKIIDEFEHEHMLEAEELVEFIGPLS